MLILTTSGEAINAQHAVRFFVQANADDGRRDGPATRCRLILQLTNRQKIAIAELASEPQGQALFREIVRQWVRGQTCIDIAACPKRTEKGEPVSNGWTGVCL